MFCLENPSADLSLITLVEFGAGYSTKTLKIIQYLSEIYENLDFIPIDISPGACEVSEASY